MWGNKRNDLLAQRYQYLKAERTVPPHLTLPAIDEACKRHRAGETTDKAKKDNPDPSDDYRRRIIAGHDTKQDN